MWVCVWKVVCLCLLALQLTGNKSRVYPASCPKTRLLSPLSLNRISCWKWMNKWSHVFGSFILSVFVMFLFKTMPTSNVVLNLLNLSIHCYSSDNKKLFFVFAVLLLRTFFKIKLLIVKQAIHQKIDFVFVCVMIDGCELLIESFGYCVDWGLGL